jgi:hypothetical protein
LLASQRLTRSVHGESPYQYFELYLLSVAGFPSVALSLTPYYAQYPALAQQSLATLFPYLENLRDHLIRIDPASSFSGAAKGPTSTASRTSTKKDGVKKKLKKQQGNREPQWGPKGLINSATGSNPASDPRDALLSANTAQIAATTSQVAYMTAAPTYWRQFDMPAPLDHAFLSSSARAGCTAGTIRTKATFSQ